MNCPLCQGSSLSLIYEVRNIPVFQNKVYNDAELAKNARTANVSLVLCQNCSFVFNSDFDMSLMNYDARYQNEQAHSPCFQDYLDGIIGIFTAKNFHKNKVIEIGCGKGYFLEKLGRYGFEVTGFDPAYEGDNPHIIKDYFTGKYSHLNAELIILRHTLEHVQNPLNFLNDIASAADYKGMIFIEVPSLEWIIQKKAFWDIFYEHCNYFTFRSLGSIFQKAEQGLLFNGQYMYLLADLRKLRTHIKPAMTDQIRSDQIRSDQISYQFLLFKEHLKDYQKFVDTHRGMLVWGGGAKGAIFVNLTDPDQEYISYVVDINPKKQNQYIAKTAHKIVDPEFLNDIKEGDILIMNENYYDEVKKDIGNLNFDIHTLGVSQ